MGNYNPFNYFSFMNVIFPVFFLLFAGVFIFILVKGIGEWASNNKQPVLTVIAKVVGKRTNTQRHSHGNDHMHSSTSTTYYASFEVESGDRMEFHVGAREYGMLAQGDIGKLTFQGSRYHGFERK